MTNGLLAAQRNTGKALTICPGLPRPPAMQVRLLAVWSRGLRHRGCVARARCDCVCLLYTSDAADDM
eukprot:11901749-Alexandrium_andersonii.AAC.1